MLEYKLTRLNDGLVNFGNNVKWVVYKPDGNSIYDEPDEGRGCVIYQSPLEYWQTTLIKAFTYIDDILFFTTENSHYKLEKYEMETT